MSGDSFNESDSRELEALLLRVHEVLLRQGRIRGGDWAFNGWLADNRAVRHKFRLDGYERTGPTVERERAARAAQTNQTA